MLNIGTFISKFIKNSSEREVKSLRSIVKQINDLDVFCYKESSIQYINNTIVN